MNSLIAAVAGTLLWLSPAAAAAHGVKARTIEIVHPWTFGTEADGTVRVGMNIKNIGKARDRLVGAKTVLARSVSLEDIVPSNDRQTPPSIDVESGGQVELSPSSRSIVLGGFLRPLGPYDTFRLTLVFERAGRIDVEVLVEERP